MTDPAISIIIPVGPGDAAWQELLPQLGARIPDCDLVLVTCRREDQPELVPAGSRWMLAERGRARQLNAGARAAHGEFLWFLHADTRLHERTVTALRRSIAAAPGAIGWFDLRFLDDGPWQMRVNEIGVWWRSRLFGMPFGDQGLFLSKASFERLGGFDETLGSAEDHALVWAAKRAGIPLRAAGAPLYTSARRYAESGWWATTSKHLGLSWTQARTFSRARKPTS